MLDILYEDNHCLAVNKPAGLLTQGDATGAPTVLDAARAYLKERYDKPGNVYVGLVHRIDQPTSGVVLLARTSKAATRLCEQFRAGTVAKVYLAIVEGTVPEESGEWADTLRKDAERNVVEIVSSEASGGRSARVAYEVIERGAGTTTLRLRPSTGRGHQLRVQLASRGLPIVGDLKYGGKRRLRALDGQFRIALHAASLTFNHPTRKEAIAVAAPVPADWPESRSGPSARPSGPGTPGEFRAQ